MNKKYIGAIVVGFVLVGYLGYYLGTKAILSSGAPADQAVTAGQFNKGPGRSGRGMGNFNGGTVLAKDDKSLTIQGRDGSSKIIFFTQTTPVSKMVAGAIADVTVGSDVMISGTPNSDGSINAEAISIRPTVKGDMQKN